MKSIRESWLSDHSDYYNDKNIKVPSVTTIMKMMNKPELLGWANFMGFKRKDIKVVQELSAINGTIIHRYIERISKGKLLTPLNDMQYISEADIAAINNSIKLYRKWKKKFKPKLIHSELSITSEYFGGTMDNISEINGKVYIIDYKTSKDVYPSMFIQLAAYYYLYTKSKYKTYDIDKVAILCVPRKGKYCKFVEMDVKHLKEFYLPVFSLLLELYTKWSGNLKYDWGKEL